MAGKELEIKLAAEREQRQADKENLQAQLADEKEKRKMEFDIWKAELDLRKAEVKLNQKRADEDIELRKLEYKRVCERDKHHDTQDESLISQTKRYDDMLKRVLPNMPSDPADLVSWWDNCEHIWDMYDIPKKYRARLLLPLLTPKLRLLLAV